MIDIVFLLLWWMLILLVPVVPVHYKKMCYGIIACLLFAGGIVTARGYYSILYPRGVIVRDVAVQVGPHETYGTCGFLKADDKIIVGEIVGTWRQVKKMCSFCDYVSVGTICGWVPQEYVCNEQPSKRSAIDIS